MEQNGANANFQDILNVLGGKEDFDFSVSFDTYSIIMLGVSVFFALVGAGLVIELLKKQL